jgi:acetylglutamate kinase
VLTVVKLGGRATENPEGLAALARQMSTLQGDLVVVHGGGAEITRWQERLALPVEWREGLRVTTPEGMQVTAMVLSGWMNKRVTSSLIAVGRSAVGISGEDGDLFRAERKDGGRLGEVGTICAVDPLVVRTLLMADLVPVVSPVSRGPQGEPLNVNADEAAISLALALEADRLLLLSDVPGVLSEGVVLGEMDPDQVRSLVERGVAGGGMRVKVEMAVRGARSGMDVRIGDHTLFDHPGTGTRVLGHGRTQSAGVA